MLNQMKNSAEPGSEGFHKYLYKLLFCRIKLMPIFPILTEFALKQSDPFKSTSTTLTITK